MPTAQTDAKSFARTLRYTGEGWLGDMPPGTDTSTHHRVEGCAFSVLADLDGDGGLDWPVRLNPRGNPDVDLISGAMHEVFEGADPDNEQQRAFVDYIKTLVGAATKRDAQPAGAVAAFLAMFCQMLADNYEVRFQNFDETGHLIDEGDEFAALLPDAFGAQWAKVNA